MFFELLRWWYGPGWRRMWQRIGVRTRNVAHAFSVSDLIQTLFSPWRRIVTVGAKGLDAKFQAALDNLVSRTVGFGTRFIVLLTALLMTSATLVMGVGIIIVWPAIPLLIVYFIVRGIV